MEYSDKTHNFGGIGKRLPILANYSHDFFQFICVQLLSNFAVSFREEERKGRRGFLGDTQRRLREQAKLAGKSWNKNRQFSPISLWLRTDAFDSKSDKLPLRWSTETADWTGAAVVESERAKLRSGWWRRERRASMKAIQRGELRVAERSRTQLFQMSSNPRLAPVLLLLPSTPSLSPPSLLHACAMASSLTILLRIPDIESQLQNVKSEWKGLYRILNRIYTACMHELFRLGRPLVSVDVVIEGVCGHSIDQIIHNASPRFLMVLAPAGWVLGDLEVPVERYSMPQTADNAEPDLPAGVRAASGGFKQTVLGGTFDHLHIGHKLLISTAILLAIEQTTVGITAPELLSKKRDADKLEPLGDRIKSVQKFCNLFRKDLTYQILPIHDVYGPTKNDKTCEAIVCSEETRRGCELSMFNLSLSHDCYYSPAFTFRSK